MPREPYDVVVHCAGGSSVAASVSEPALDFAKTVPALEAVLDAQPAARIVLVSSAAVYGAREVQPIAEDAPAQPISPYGEHKLACEQLVRERARAAAIVRLFSIYGAGLERQLLWDACCRARDGRARFAGTGRERRDWLHVTDASKLLVTAVDAAAPGAPVINGGSGTGTRVVDAVELLFGALGVAEPPLFDGSTRAGDPPDYIADVRRAAELGWRPMKSLADGLDDYARWFRARP